jgi:protease I
MKRALELDLIDAVALPGGVSMADQLRTDAAAVAFVRSAFGAGRPAAVICHAPWTLVESDLLRGRRLTSWPSRQTDIRNVGGTWVDEAVVTRAASTTSVTSGGSPHPARRGRS